MEAAGKIRLRPEIALTCLHLAELLLEHYPEERAEAQEYLDFAIGELRNQAEFLDSDLRERLGEVDTPTLVVHGDGDLQVPYALRIELANGIAGAELVTIPGAGHGVIQWRTAVEAIRAFCDRIIVAPAER